MYNGGEGCGTKPEPLYTVILLSVSTIYVTALDAVNISYFVLTWWRGGGGGGGSCPIHVNDYTKAC